MKKKKRGPTAFTDEFRREAVRLADTGAVPIPQLARELGVHVETLRNWRRRARGDTAVPGAALVTGAALEAENRRLRRELALLREEREILKKATAFFAKDAR
jgi:transposase